MNRVYDFEHHVKIGESLEASGRLPVTFPRSLDQLPHPAPPHDGDVGYSEGAAVGYKWFDKNNLEPLFAFGHGLSYTSFAYENLKVSMEGSRLVASVDIRNTGKRAGADVAQLYLKLPAGSTRRASSASTSSSSLR